MIVPYCSVLICAVLLFNAMYWSIFITQFQSFLFVFFVVYRSTSSHSIQDFFNGCQCEPATFLMLWNLDLKEPLYNEVLGITNYILQPGLLKCMEQNLVVTNSRYNEPISLVPWHFVKGALSRRSCCILVKLTLLKYLSMSLFCNIKLLLPHREEIIKVFLPERTNHNQFLATSLKYTGKKLEKIGHFF